MSTFSKPSEGMYMPGANLTATLRYSHQNSVENDLVAAAAADPLALHH